MHYQLTKKTCAAETNYMYMYMYMLHQWSQFGSDLWNAEGAFNVIIESLMHCSNW